MVRLQPGTDIYSWLAGVQRLLPVAAQPGMTALCHWQTLDELTEKIPFEGVSGHK